MTSRVDQCNARLAGATKSVTDTLQRVMNAAARVVSDTRKFDHGLTKILHDDLHWLDVADRITYKLGVIMHRCRHDKALQYLVDCCTPVSNVEIIQTIRKQLDENHCNWSQRTLAVDAIVIKRAVVDGIWCYVWTATVVTRRPHQQQWDRAVSSSK